MTVARALALLATAVPLVARLVGAEPVAGTWLVEVTGEISSSCTALIQRQGNKVTGTLVCPQAGLQLPIRATIGPNGAITPQSGDLGWTATANGDTAAGTYQGSLGAGSWTAVRQP